MSGPLVIGKLRGIGRSVLRDLLGGGSAGPSFEEMRLEPCIDVFEIPEGTVIKMDIAGMKRRSISVELEGETLVIKGRRDDRSKGRKIRFHHMEIEYGAFERRVRIEGPVREEAISARYRDGFLEVRLPRRRSARRDAAGGRGL